MRYPDLVTDEPIFIFATGQRCGSTLLQRLLNSHPDILIWGEHNGYLNSFFWASDGLIEWSLDKAAERENFLDMGSNNFLPNLSPPPDVVKDATARHIELLFAEPARELGRKIWGFKEIRYQFSIALRLQQYFPRARFIHLTRRIQDCLVSLKRWEASGNWRREWTRRSVEHWISINDGFLARGQELNRLLSVRYEDMVGQNAEQFTGALAEFLSVSSQSFDQNVFRAKLDGVDPSVPKASLEEEDLAMISSPEIQRLSKALRYM